MGIITYWLNRTGLEWSHDMKPDYEINSLIEAAPLLSVGNDSESLPIKKHNPKHSTSLLGKEA